MRILHKSKKAEKRWLATFADLITLLLTFFVIMLGMAQVDIDRFESAVLSLQEDRGVITAEEYQQFVTFSKIHINIKYFKCCYNANIIKNLSEMKNNL